ncbi:MAG: hypothetical protein M1828_004987 [Chrysothrix sp. TS-e1954]|nr:MAG: hypothetical protein M1828_004987 [Chrysothrix sp. TS-e1954]
MPSSEDFKEALFSIAPIPFDDLPPDNELPDFLRKSYTDADLILCTLPDCPNAPTSTTTSFTPAAANSATTGQDTYCDPSQVPGLKQHPDYAQLQKQWGKPIKPSNNPLGVSCYKTAAHDRRGAWFARRSLHQGLGFERWKRGLQREFATSLKVNEGPGIGAIRGIKADKRLERKLIQDMGKIEVYQTSAAFPGPVTPREFVTLMISATDVLPSFSKSFTNTDNPDEKPRLGRSFLLTSRPTEHHDAMARPELVSGTFESIECIREIPLSVEDPESNPVEWIMLTRSEPGGGIPKFMVERGTPGGIVSDVVKWLNWACKEENTGSEVFEDDDNDDEKPEDSAAVANGEQQDDVSRSSTAEKQPDADLPTPSIIESPPAEADSSQDPSRSPGLPHDPSESGMFTRLTAAAVSYLPTSTTSLAATPTASRPISPSIVSSSSSSSSLSSDATFRSAHDGAPPSHFSTAPTHLKEGTTATPNPTDPADAPTRELAALATARQNLELRIQKSRDDDSQKAAALAARNTSDTAKTLDRLEKQRQKQEARYRKELEKLDARRVKEEKKAAERARKALAKDEVARLKREVGEWRERSKVAEREVEVLRRQIEGLRGENTSLAARLSASDLGNETVKRLREEERESGSGRSRASTGRSRASSSATKKTGST